MNFKVGDILRLERKYLLTLRNQSDYNSFKNDTYIVKKILNKGLFTLIRNNNEDETGEYFHVYFELFEEHIPTFYSYLDNIQRNIQEDL